VESIDSGGGGCYIPALEFRDSAGWPGRAGAIMADIISLDTRFQQARDQKKEHLAERKARTVASVFQPTRSLALCDKCGAAEPPRSVSGNGGTMQARVPYRFCSTCAQEYDDFIQCLQGNGDPDHYWQNNAWLESWKRWIDYQGSMASFRTSKAFRRLVQEIKNDRP
jgi:hypothetical protein